MAASLWTLEELTGHVALALADGYLGVPSARVRDLPDARTIRWYTTRGLVDPPLTMRGRQARYGQRHLLQLVALKRRQARGVPLAVIQTELAGLPDAELARIAALPPALAVDAGRPDTISVEPARTRFWSTTPSRHARNSNPTDSNPTDNDPTIDTVHRIRLAPGVVLLIDGDLAARPHPEGSSALRAAATPLLDLLGTTNHGEGTPR